MYEPSKHDVGLMLVRRLRRRSSIKPASDKRLAIVGQCVVGDLK